MMQIQHSIFDVWFS